jgi:hypothetical protein
VTPDGVSEVKAISITFNLHDDIIEVLRTIKQKLVRGFRRDADDISSGNFLPEAALNSAVALFVRRDGLPVHERSSYDERRRTGLYKHNVYLGFMPLRLPVRFTMNKKDGFIGEVSKLLNGEMVRVG